MLRTGEARVAFLTLLFTLLGVRQGIELWSSWGTPSALAFDLAGIAEASVLAAGVAGVTVLTALWRALSASTVCLLQDRVVRTVRCGPYSEV